MTIVVCRDVVVGDRRNDLMIYHCTRFRAFNFLCRNRVFCGACESYTRLKIMCPNSRLGCTRFALLYRKFALRYILLLLFTVLKLILFWTLSRRVFFLNTIAYFNTFRNIFANISRKPTESSIIFRDFKYAHNYLRISLNNYLTESHSPFFLYRRH